MTPNLRIAPSVLACDFSALGEAAHAVEAGGADLLHVDVMDGRFVPNISIGVPIVEALQRSATVPLDVHLMVVEPDRHVGTFAAAGASMISVHAEATVDLARTLSAIRAHGATAGAVISPDTPVATLGPVADLVDYLVVMSVHPGYAGQAFIPESTARVREARALLDAAGNRAPVEIDGGVGLQNAAELTAAGAEILVAASAIYGADNPAEATRALREAALAGLALAGNA